MSRIAWGVVVWGLVCAGCSTDGGCPEGQHSVRGICVPMVDGGETDGGTDDGAADDGGDEIVICEPTGDFTGFGDACTSQSECSCPAGTCNTDMGEYCTELNCMRTDADGGMIQVCPPSWSCVSVAGLPGVPPGVDSICVRP